jgi:uncharacterized protein YcfL
MLSLRRFAPVVLIAAFIALVGCTAPIAAKNDEVKAYPEITLSQRSLERQLGFQPPTVARVSNNLLQVTVPVRAKTDHEMNVEYKVVWFDIIGQVIKPETGWVPLRLEPRQPQTVTVQSTSEDAVRYNLQFRVGRE